MGGSRRRTRIFADHWWARPGFAFGSKVANIGFHQSFGPFLRSDIAAAPDYELMGPADANVAGRGSLGRETA
jgi:hypothetical protein